MTCCCDGDGTAGHAACHLPPPFADGEKRDDLAALAGGSPTQPQALQREREFA